MQNNQSAEVAATTGGLNPWSVVRVIESGDSNVKKYVFENKDAVAESVLYRYGSYRERTVICCSTQSGCPVGCRFCGAGDAFARSLTYEEILAQPVRLLGDTGEDVNSIKRLQIMFMSMGEPLLNQRALFPAIRTLHSIYPKAALLISTVAPEVDYYKLHCLSAEIPTVGLQFSVHESTDEARNKLIPFTKKIPLRQISFVGQRWHAITGRQPFINYCAHPGNTSSEDIERLVGLFHPSIFQYTVSVICERDEHVAAANERQRALASEFMQKLLERGCSVRMFDPAGQDDIGGGCGQLWFVQDWMRQHVDHVRPSIGSGLVKIHTPVAPDALR